MGSWAAAWGALASSACCCKSFCWSSLVRFVFRLITNGRRPGDGGWPKYLLPAAGCRVQACRAMPWRRQAGGPPPIAISQADYQQFEQLLQGVQAAWTAHDLHGLQAMATPEMVSYFAEQLSEQVSRGVRNSVTDVQPGLGRPVAGLGRTGAGLCDGGDAVFDDRRRRGMPQAGWLTAARPNTSRRQNSGRSFAPAAGTGSCRRSSRLGKRRLRCDRQLTGIAQAVGRRSDRISGNLSVMTWGRHRGDSWCGRLQKACHKCPFLIRSLIRTRSCVVSCRRCARSPWSAPPPTGTGPATS